VFDFYILFLPAIHNQLELTCDDETYTFQVQSKDEQRNYVNTFYKARYIFFPLLKLF